MELDEFQELNRKYAPKTQYITKECKYCGKSFEIDKREDWGPYNKFCSKGCSHRYRDQKDLDYQKYVVKARKEYRETGQIDSKRACILLSCKPMRDLAIQKCDDLGLSEATKQKTIEIITQYEKRRGIGATPRIRTISAGAVYLAGLITKESVTQDKIAAAFDIVAATVRSGYRCIRNLIKFERGGKIEWKE